MRKARKQKKTKKKRRSATQRVGVPRTAQEYFAKPEPYQDRWNRVVHVISKMRADGLSLSLASREFGVDPRTVLQLGGSAVRKRANGRYAAKTRDRLLRVLAIPNPGGLREVA